MYTFATFFKSFFTDKNKKNKVLKNKVICFAENFEKNSRRRITVSQASDAAEAEAAAIFTQCLHHIF